MGTAALVLGAALAAGAGQAAYEGHEQRKGLKEQRKIQEQANQEQERLASIEAGKSQVNSEQDTIKLSDSSKKSALQRSILTRVANKGTKLGD